MLTLDQLQKMSESNSWVNAKGSNLAVNSVRPKNAQNIRKNLWQNEEIKSFRESFIRKHGFDWADQKKFPVMEDGFSWKKVANKLGFPSVGACMREADSATSFSQVLRAGIQQIVNNSYETVATTFETWTSTVNSNKDTELYAPLHGISFLREQGKQEKYSESYAAGLDIKLINRKYGEVFAVEKELLEDDQTGQFAKQASLLGEYAKLCIEAICYGKLAGTFTSGAQAQYAQLLIPPTETQPSNEANYPFASSAAPLQGGGINKPATFTVLNNAGIQAAFIGLMNQKNLLGLKMNVDGKRLIISPTDRFNAAILLNSSFYPSVASASAGATGSSFAINPIESIAALTISRFMFKNDGTVNGDSRAWYLADDSKPFFVTQIREAASVVQEAPNSGESFDRDIFRWKLTLRGNADYIDPRFIWQGNDGSVTS